MTERIRRRADFSSKTRELIAQRAGYRCSFPNCDQITIGPNKHQDKSSNTGVAAHIYGAATSGGGPRGTGGLSKKELQSPQNAIWLCGHHASLIDKHGGADFPPEKLFSYKALHEARIAHALSGIHTPFGWVDKMKIHSSPISAEKFEFDFAKLTLITGANSVGKTALCQWLAGVTHAQYLERWAGVPTGRKRLFLEVDYHDPEPHTVSVSFLSDKHPEYKIDKTLTTIATVPLKVVFPKTVDYFNDEDEDRPNDLELISNALNLHPYEITALCKDMSRNGSGFVKRAWFEKNHNSCILFTDVEGDDLSPWKFRALSHSQRDRVIMELGILAANQFAVIYPTLLILDSGTSPGFWRFDKGLLRLYSDFLGSPACKFQTVISLIPERVKINKSIWDGWKVIELDRKPPNVSIRSDIVEAAS